VDATGSSTTGSGDRCKLCTVLGSSRRVPATAADPPAAAALADASAAVTHAAAAYGIYAACSNSTWGPTATAFALDCSAYHHYDDSSSTAQWASESGTASSSVCFTPNTCVPVIVLASGSPTVHSISDGLHTGSVILAICA
jgi:hypothetical protein